MKKKIISVLLAAAMVTGMTACGNSSDNENKDTAAADQGSVPETQQAADDTKKDEQKGDLPTVTFVHGYYHDASEWPVAEKMRQIYQEFADAHKDEYKFEIVADEGGAEGIYNTAINDISAGEFYDIADFGGWNITDVAVPADAVLDLKPYLDEDAAFKAGVGVCYDQNLTADDKIYTVKEGIEAVGFWYNEALFQKAGADTPDKWSTWDDFDTAVDKLTTAKIMPFGLNAGWPTNILAAAYMQRDDASRKFYEEGKAVSSMKDDAFKGTMEFIQKNALQKIDAANFGPGGDDDEQYRSDFFDGNTAMLFNGVWDAGGSIDCGAGAENIKPAIFPTNEPGKKAALMSGGCGYVVSNKLDEVQTKACVDFIKYMTSKEIAERMIKEGIGMASSTAVDYDAIAGQVDTADAKLLIEACKLCQSADYKALGLGNNFGDLEGEIQSKYAGLKDDSTTPDTVITELDAFIAAAE